MPAAYVVQPGDGLDNIAFAHGFAPDSIWLLPENAELRERRHDDRNALLPGDIVMVPDKAPAIRACATGARHVFRRRGVPARLRLQFCRDHEPRRGVPYVLVIGGVERRGTTDGDGCLAEFVSPDVTEAVITVGDGPPMRLTVGHLAPADSERGVMQRLRNLGYLQARTDVGEALARFQQDCSLSATGVLDHDTLVKLREIHDSPALVRNLARGAQGSHGR